MRKNYISTYVTIWVQIKKSFKFHIMHDFEYEFFINVYLSVNSLRVLPWNILFPNKFPNKHSLTYILYSLLNLI